MGSQRARSAAEAVCASSRTATADAPAADQVHAAAVVHERRERSLDAVVDVPPVRIGDPPGRVAQHREQGGQAVQQHRPVTALVGDGGVLDERAVPVEAVAFGDVPEDGGQRGGGQRGLARIGPDQGAQQHHRAQVHPVGAGAGAAVFDQAALRHEVVHRVRERRALPVRQVRADQHGRVEQPHGDADLPVPPVAVGVRARGVDPPPVVVDAGGDRRGQPGVPGHGVRPSHGQQPGRGLAEGRERQVGPEGPGGGRHGGPMAGRGPDPGPALLDRHLAPPRTQRAQRAGEIRGRRIPPHRERHSGRGHAAEQQHRSPGVSRHTRIIT
jgi:hypothetical protein